MEAYLRCIIVDDEPMARKSLELLADKSPHLAIAGIYDNAVDALKYLSTEAVDLIFLDVEMPDMSGIELMDRIGHGPRVILTSSKTEYAFEAYQYNVIDYLQKPITLPRFKEAIDKAVTAMISDTDVKPRNDEIYVRENGRLVRIPFDEILYFENAGDYVSIRTTKKSHLILGTIKNIEARLAGNQFLKVHRSYIVNLDKIKDIEEGTLVIEGKVVPVSRSQRNALLKHINLL